jgi:predicted metal-dependent enzyme (double-stranded beta helix superfamily)
LQSAFRFLLTNDTVATRNVQDSYRHDNGFTKLLLFAAPTDEFKVRLHVWPKPYGSEHNIHDHRFNFWSAVLRGKLRNTIWTLGPGEERQHYRYYPRKAQGRYRLERVGPATLARERQFDVHQDASYRFDSNLLHTVESHGSAVTLLVEDRTSLRPFANVFISTTSRSSLLIDSPSLTLDEYRAELLHCAEELPMVHS